MKRTDPQFKLRLPAALKDKVDKAADAGSRTTSNEIIRRLEWSFAAEEEQQTGKALKAIQASPRIEMEKRLISVEAELREEIEALKDRLAKLEK